MSGFSLGDFKLDGDLVWLFGRGLIQDVDLLLPAYLPIIDEDNAAWFENKWVGLFSLFDQLLYIKD